MKALVISDRPEITDFVSPLLKEKGFDLIHYRWIIKALDNIEEIQPDVIVLSALEYPRHWKTLAGFVQSGIGGNDVKVYLYDTTPLSSEDSEKACDLGVQDFEEAFIKRHSLEVEIAINQPCGKIQFYNGDFYPEEDLAECQFPLESDEGFIKYVTVFDGNSITAFSADAEKTDGGFNLHVKEYYEKKI